MTIVGFAASTSVAKRASIIVVVLPSIPKLRTVDAVRCSVR